MFLRTPTFCNGDYLVKLYFIIQKMPTTILTCVNCLGGLLAFLYQMVIRPRRRCAVVSVNPSPEKITGQICPKHGTAFPQYIVEFQLDSLKITQPFFCKYESEISIVL
jgi:hypothetical protein